MCWNDEREKERERNIIGGRACITLAVASFHHRPRVY